MPRRLSFFLLLLSLTVVSRAQDPAVPAADRIRLAEAFRLNDAVGDKLWPEWKKTAFPVLLVTPEYEFLVRHPQPSKDFAALGYDELLRSDVFYRRRTQPVDFLATFPFVGGLSTVVIGQAENTTARSSTPWTVTVLHEHFHQLQDFAPGYFAAMNALDLAGGDTTGMWNINYPFPYRDSDVDRQFGVLARMLAETLETKDEKEFRPRLAAYLDERRKFAGMLKPADYRYLSFQLWKEGVARYTEYRVAALAARKYRPGREFKALPDFRPYADVAAQIRQNILKQLATRRLSEAKRELFYPFGAAEALLLDRARPGWQSRYLAEKFYLEKYFEEKPLTGAQASRFQ